MGFILHEFEIYPDENNLSCLKFKIEKEANIVNYDEILKMENKEDIELLHAIEKYINSRAVI